MSSQEPRAAAQSTCPTPSRCSRPSSLRATWQLGYKLKGNAYVRTSAAMASQTTPQPRQRKSPAAHTCNHSDESCKLYQQRCTCNHCDENCNPCQHLPHAAPGPRSAALRGVGLGCQSCIACRKYAKKVNVLFCTSQCVHWRPQLQYAPICRHQRH